MEDGCVLFVHFLLLKFDEILVYYIHLDACKTTISELDAKQDMA